ncbi:MAG: hypothetical protein BGN88_13605 [Clostridiales bacterium 43-6]|nr:MAG: hypothetical protein BGN88_13605 [Clostridiales bacterium 43-6]
MLVAERQQKIIHLLKTEKMMTVEQLCKRLYSSGATIRRDLTSMSRAGQLKRIHGGAVLLDGTSTESPFLVRENEQYDVKLSLAKAACDSIQNGQTIFMDSSSTVLQMAKFLPSIEGLTVITNGIKTAMQLAPNSNIQTYCAGGKMRENSFSLTGVPTFEFFNHYNADIAFLSCRGFDFEKGVTEANEEEAQIKRVLVSRAKKVVLLCDNTKIGQTYLSRVCETAGIHLLVTNAIIEQTRSHHSIGIQVVTK